MTIVLGLTGSIGMGKSTTAGFFRDLGVPVWDADKTVHDLYAEGGAAVSQIGILKPEAIKSGAVDRSALRSWIATEADALSQIESIVHPLVARSRAEFLETHRNAPLVVLDVPLLFESGVDGWCDATLVVSVPAEVQRERVLSRTGMTQAHLDLILQKQMPDAQKRARADHVIQTLSPEQTKAEVESLVATLLKQANRA